MGKQPCTAFTAGSSADQAPREGAAQGGLGQRRREMGQQDQSGESRSEPARRSRQAAGTTDCLRAERAVSHRESVPADDPLLLPTPGSVAGTLPRWSRQWSGIDAVLGGVAGVPVQVCGNSRIRSADCWSLYQHGSGEQAMHRALYRPGTFTWGYRWPDCPDQNVNRVERRGANFQVISILTLGLPKASRASWAIKKAIRFPGLTTTE